MSELAPVPSGATTWHPAAQLDKPIVPSKPRGAVEAQGEKALDQYLEQEIFPALGLTKEDEAHALTEATEDNREILERSFQNIRDTVVALYQLDTVDGRVDVKTMKEREKREKRFFHPSEFKRRLTREQMTKELLQEKEWVAKSGFINLNIKLGALEQLLKEGKFRDASNMSPEELARLGKSERSHDEYQDNRRMVEVALGIYKSDEVIVYGSYASDYNGELQKGGAEAYGKIFIKFKPSTKAVFTEGDSVNLHMSETVREKLEKQGINYRGDYPGSARARQIAPEHAALAKAITNLDHKRQIEMGTDKTDVCYLEAQILNPTLDDMESINIPKTEARSISNLQENPKWKDKIVFTDA